MNEANNSKFVTRKLNIGNENSNLNYDLGSETIYYTKVVKSSLCDYNHAYILVTGNITIKEHQATQVAFKNFAPFTKYIPKIDETIDDAEHLDLVMSMQNSIENSSNYSETTGSLWFYSKDEATDFNADIANINNFKSFMYKAKLLENTETDGETGILKSATIAVPLKYLSNFCRSLEIPLINCKIELKLKLTNYCVSSAAGADNANDKDDSIIFAIKDTILYVPVVILSARDNQNLLKLHSKGFERLVYCNDYKAKSENKNTTNDYRYCLKLNFVEVNRLFVLVYTNQDFNFKRLLIIILSS